MGEVPEAVVVIAAIVAAIMLLTVFFKTTSWIGRKLEKNPARIKLKGILNDGTPATVHLTSGTVILNVRMVGFIDAASPKSHLPYELGNMVILEHADGRRTMVQAKNIRMIEVGPAK